MKHNNNIIRRLFEPVRLFPLPFLKSSLQSTIWSFFDICVVLLAQYVGNLIEGHAASGAVYMKIFRFFFIALCFYTFIKFLMRHRGWTEIHPLYNAKIASLVYKKYFLLDYTYIEKSGTGRIINIISNGIEQWVMVLLTVSYDIPIIIFKLVFTGYFVFRLGIRYGVGFFAGLVLAIVMVNALNKKAHNRRKVRKMYEIERSRHNIRMITSKQEVLQNNKENDEINRYKEYSYAIYTSGKKISNIVHRMRSLPIFFVSLVTASSIAYAGLTMDNGTFSLGTYAALVALSGMLTPTIKKITEGFNNLSKYWTHIEKLWSFIDEAPMAPNINSGSLFEGKDHTITLSKISFSYDNGETIVSDLSLAIDGGTKVALVGPSGGGKSTIVKLIAGYLRPDSGTVSVDGQNLSEINLKTYYKHIGYLTQEPSVFDGTIRENLTYAVGDVDDNIIKEAIHNAQCDFIWDLSDGLETEIGERGTMLSGGQRQRLAIAKIFLKNPNIIILDEPTSALDSESEEKVTIAMNKLFENRTVIVIAHRLQTVKHSDAIFYIENGQVAEQGNHKELMAQKGKYYQMVELQSGF